MDAVEFRAESEGKEVTSAEAAATPAAFPQAPTNIMHCLRHCRQAGDTNGLRQQSPVFCSKVVRKLYIGSGHRELPLIVYKYLSIICLQLYLFQHYICKVEALP